MTKDPRELKIEDYQYDLPEDRVAIHPLPQRDASKLLHFARGRVKDFMFRDLPELLNPADLLVYNDSKVIHARLIFKTPDGQRVEIFCLQPEGGYASLSESGSGRSVWECLVGGNRKWKEGALEIEGTLNSRETLMLRAERVSQSRQGFLIAFSWSPPSASFSEVLEVLGRLPVPPYLNRDSEEEDEVRYQTVFARQEGSVAAPTAGLHFTENVFNDLAAKGVCKAMITLHVGAGTFLPVKAESMGGHEMHDEAVVADRHLLSALIQAPRVVAVGTTSLRSLESLYWLAADLSRRPGGQLSAELGQWAPYEHEVILSRTEAMQLLLRYMEQRGMEELSFRTSLMIAPPYKLKIADALITNFHQPRSTLLLLVAAVCGEDWRMIYRHSLEQGYRFLSYGDSSLLERA